MLTLTQFKDKLNAEGSARFTTPPPLEYFWCFDVAAPREEFWAYLSDTSRFNRAIGFEPRVQVERDGKQFVSTTMLGRPQEWIEEPWTWINGQTMTSTRQYIKGMARFVHSVFHVEDLGERRRVYIYFGWQPASRFWAWVLRTSEKVVQKKFTVAFAQIDALIASAKAHPQVGFRRVAPPLGNAGRAKLDEVRQALLAKTLEPKVIDRLCTHIETADDLDLESLRLPALALDWNVKLDDLIAVSLHATRLGMLRISWDVICPHCRGSRVSADTLGAIPAEAECDVCELEFGTDQPDSIEVLFHVHDAVRTVPKLLYCAAEPAKKSHIKVQQVLAGGQSLKIDLTLKPGLYRARAMNQEQVIEVGEGPHAIDAKLGDQPQKASSPLHFGFTNSTAQACPFVLEELWWEARALKPAHVLAHPDFRDVFSLEHLNADVKLFLGDQTILFTDIVGSTKFYAEVGDARAFAEVRRHFQDVYAEVAKHRGVVVKTIGDAVMASFPSGEDAVQAAIDIQKRFPPERRDTSIRLRISIHCGPVIAVQLNTGIDYFGNTINYAAKIQSVAGAHEIALSEAALAFHHQRDSFKVDRRRNSRDGFAPADVFVVKVVDAGLRVAA